MKSSKRIREIRFGKTTLRTDFVKAHPKYVSIGPEFRRLDWNKSTVNDSNYSWKSFCLEIESEIMGHCSGLGHFKIFFQGYL